MDEHLGLTERQRDAICQLDVGDVELDAALGPWTRLGIGGPCGALIVVRGERELKLLTRWIRRERLPLTPLTRKTERVVRAGGIRGVAVVLGEGFAGTGRQGGHVHIGGAASADTLAAYGLPELIVPGAPTVAACLDQLPPGRGDAVVEVEVVLGKGRRSTPSQLELGARRLGLRDEAIVLELVARPGEPVEHVEVPLPGIALFRDPARGSSAADLLARTGLLGVRIRGALIDPDHPNRLVDAGGATARDVGVLVEWARARIAAEWGVQLEPAVRMVGISSPRSA